MSLRLLSVIAIALGLAPTASAMFASAPDRPRITDSCQPVVWAKGTPPLNALLDSLGLLGALRARDVSAAGDVVVSVQLAKHPIAHVVDDLTPSPAQDSLAVVVLGALRPVLKDAPDAFRVRITRGASPSLALEQSVLCPPERADTVSNKIQASVKRTPSVAPVQPRPVQLKLRISATGEVTSVDLGLGSGVREIDAGFRDMARSFRFAPALLDGRPVEVWMQAGNAWLVR